MDRDSVFIDLSGKTFTFTTYRLASRLKQLLRIKEERVDLKFTVRPLPFRQLVFNEALMAKVDASLKEKGGYLDIESACRLLFGDDVDFLSKEALDTLWDAYRELNYPKVAPTVKTETPSAEVQPSVSSSDGPSTSVERSSTT